MISHLLLQNTYARITVDGKFISGAGKLYWYWTNTKRNYRNAGLLPKVGRNRGKKRKFNDREEDGNNFM